MFRKLIFTILLTLPTVIAACGGSDDAPTGGGVVLIVGEEETNKAESVIGAPNLETANQQTVSPSSESDDEVALTPTTIPKPIVTVEPTATAPSKTIDEKLSGGLVDDLSAEDYPRTSARHLEREFRREPEAAASKMGKSFVVQGDVLEAGVNDVSESYVSFKAGAGKVTCIFDVITEAELLRFSPGGTNAVVGTIDNWNDTDRILTLKDCLVVVGY